MILEEIKIRVTELEERSTILLWHKSMINVKSYIFLRRKDTVGLKRKGCKENILMPER